MHPSFFGSEEVADEMDKLRSGEEQFYSPTKFPGDASPQEVLRIARQKARDKTRRDLASIEPSRSVEDGYEASAHKQPREYSSLEGHTPKGKPTGVEIDPNMMQNM